MKQRKLLVSIVAIVLSVLMLGGVFLSVLPVPVSAASSSELKNKINDLQSKADEIAAQAADLQQQIADNQSETQSIVDKKANIDQQIELTRQQVENLNQQIQQYNLLIAAKQEELDRALENETKLNEQYKLRLRAMEETGNVSYWSVLFNASSFTDLLDRIDMIHEISEADQIMLQQLRDVADQISAAKAEVEAGRAELEAAKAEQDVLEQQLSEQRAEADAMITELMSKQDELKAASETYDAMEEEVRQQILETQKAYEDALADEEAQRQIEAARQEAASGNISRPSGGANSSGFVSPLPAGSSYVSCAYGYREHPIYGYYSMHYGVDLAAGAGTPIYAVKSGTVTTATYSSVNGYYVSISHNDGFGSLYAHMTNYVVSVGDYVNQGDIIGYVGSTGWSTGAHLHFEVFYGGANVNPMDYISI